MVGNEEPSLEKAKELERVLRRQMTTPKTGLPPRRMSDRQERDVELTTGLVQMALDEVMRITGKRRVAGEEATVATVVQQVHVGRRAPSIEAVAISPMTRRRRE